MRLKLAVALGTVYLVWGSTYLAIAVADRSLPPLLMLSVRFLIAGGIMLAWAAWRGDLRGALPSRREWGAAAVVGLLLLVIDTGGVALAEQRVPTGQAALLIASVPLFTALLDRTFLKTKLPLGAVAGIGAGLLGVGLLVGTGGRIDPLGTAVLLVAAFAWSAGSLVARVAPLPRKPFVSAALQMLCGGVMLGIIGASAGEVSQVRLDAISPASLGAVAFLVVFGSIGAFTAFGWLLRHVSIPVLSTYSYVNPAVAVALGWLVMGEHVAGREIAAGLVIVASVGLLLFSRHPEPDAEPTSETLQPYIRGKDAQAESFRSAPRLAELRRIGA
jgi:drug/metabolite transporter (DMT)-like permease